ncbi:MAG: hypothetical protein ACJ764_09545 [Solirubrobacteraceae bacterium]
MSETVTTTRAPQRLQALERANEIRLARAELKRRIAFGGVSAAEVILDPPLAAKSWAIGELLLSQRRWGSTRCRKFLLRNQITETKPVGALTDRQRRLLAGQLKDCTCREPEVSPGSLRSAAPREPEIVPPVERPGVREPVLALA